MVVCKVVLVDITVVLLPCRLTCDQITTRLLLGSTIYSYKVL